MIFRRSLLLVRTTLAAAMLIGGPAFAAAESVVPVHGTVISLPSPGTAVVRLDAVPSTSAASTARYRVPTSTRLRPETEIDALRRAPSTTGALPALEDVAPAARYEPGIPDPSVRATLDVNSLLPATPLVDQNGHKLRLDAWRDKVTLVSFIFTRCPDREICPAISGKFAYLQGKLDPEKTHLVTVTLDPAYDSPAVLASYGTTFGADPSTWTLATGEQQQIRHLVALFGLSNLRNTPETLVHDEILAIAAPGGRIVQMVPTAGWAPDDVLATVSHITGAESNPIRRWELDAIAGVVASCGGSVTTSVVVLDSVVFVLGVLILGGVLAWFGRRIFSKA